MQIIEQIDYSKLIDIVFRATNQLYLSLPSIDEEIAEILISRTKEINIKVLIDNSEESIRNGFGEIIGIDKLIQNKIEIYQSEGNLISFIISDNDGYFLFPQSKIFIENPKGTNAFKLDPVTIQILIQHFFQTEKQSEEIQFNQLATIGDSIKYFESAFEELQLNDSCISKFNAEHFDNIKKKLNINPPLSPNLQRQINTYSAKIQYVELKFFGGNFKNRIGQLPKNAIPINSDELKNLLNTRIKMFQDIDQNPEFIKFKEFKDKIENLRKAYLTPITCRPGKNIVNIENKEKFLKDLEILKVESKKMTKLLVTMLEEGKFKTLDLLRDELATFFKENEPQEVKEILKIEVKDRKLNEIINSIILSVKFPKVSNIIDGISLKEHFYDLTWNDFKDEKLLKEFLEKKIMEKDEIDSIVDLKKAFDIKN